MSALCRIFGHSWQQFQAHVYEQDAGPLAKPVRIEVKHVCRRCDAERSFALGEGQ